MAWGSSWGIVTLFDERARVSIGRSVCNLMLGPGRTSPAARPGRLWREHDDIDRRSSGVGADGSDRRSSRAPRGNAAPAQAI